MTNLVCNHCGHINSEFDLTCTSCGRSLPLDSIHSVSFGAQPTQPPSEEMLQPGDRLAHFEIIEKIGQGGIGAVYKARDLQLNRPVALKLFRFAADARSGGDILRKEAELASSLNHPNVVTIYDIDRTGEMDFIAMEWVDGKSLGGLIPPGGFDLETGLEYAHQAAKGLENAHTHGIVHRDIKPQNLMVDHDDQVKILDFGVARIRAAPDVPNKDQFAAVDETTHGALKGTLPYMSPEQARGETLDARADIFSFGAMLYEMFSGRRAFEGEHPAQILNALFNDHPPALQENRADLPPRLIELIDHCLAKSPEKRPQSMRQVRESLKDLLRQTGEHVQSAAPIDKLTVRRPFLWAMLLSLSILFAFYLPHQLKRPTTESAAAQVAPTKIAVLPFENISGDPTLQVLCNGLAADLSVGLSRLERYRPETWIVAARELRDLPEQSAEAVHQKFGVDLVIAGSVQHLGPTRRLTLELIDAATARQLHAEIMDVPEERLFEITGKVMETVLGFLNWDLPEKAHQAVTANATTISGAYREYLFGQGYLYRYDQSEHSDRARQAFERSLALDPNYVPAAIGLAHAHYLLWRSRKEADWLEQALTTARHARQIGPNYPSVHAVLGLILLDKGELQAAAEAYEHALALDPSHIEAQYGLARVFQARNEHEKAEAMYREAIQRHPNNWIARSHLSVFYFDQGAYEKAETVLRELIALAPNNSLGYTNLAGVLHMLGREDEAIETLNQAAVIAPSARLFTNMGTILFFAKRYDEAVTAFEEAVNRHPGHYSMWGNLADGYRWSSQQQGKAPAAYREAIKLVTKLLEVNPNNTNLQYSLALFQAKAGETGSADATLEKATPPNSGAQYFKAAVTYEILGKRAKAIDNLNQALALGYPHNEINNDPELEKLRQSPEFTVSAPRQ